MPAESVGMLPSGGPPPVTTVAVAVGGTVVGVLLGVAVGVLVGVSVGVLVGVAVGVLVGVSVGVLVDVAVDVTGVTPTTMRQLGATPLMALATVTPAAVLVKDAGLPVQSGFNCPDAFVTLTVTVHVELVAGAPAGTWRLLTVIKWVPSVAVVTAAALTHVPPTEPIPTTRPAGRVSVKPTFDSAGAPAGLVKVKVRVVVPPSVMAMSEKLLVSVGGTPPANAGAVAPAATVRARARAGSPKRFLFMTRV
jgi:hypothetical protein